MSCTWNCLQVHQGLTRRFQVAEGFPDASDISQRGIINIVPQRRWFELKHHIRGYIHSSIKIQRFEETCKRWMGIGLSIFYWSRGKIVAVTVVKYRSLSIFTNSEIGEKRSGDASLSVYWLVVLKRNENPRWQWWSLVRHQYGTNSPPVPQYCIGGFRLAGESDIKKPLPVVSCQWWCPVDATTLVCWPWQLTRGKYLK